MNFFENFDILFHDRLFYLLFDGLSLFYQLFCGEFRRDRFHRLFDGGFSNQIFKILSPWL